MRKTQIMVSQQIEELRLPARINFGVNNANNPKQDEALVIQTSLALGLRCPECGQAVCDDIPLWAVRQGSRRQTCVCGCQVSALSVKRPHRYFFQAQCFFCGEIHVYSLRGREIWRGRSRELGCPYGDFPLGLLGAPEEVARRVAEWEAGDPWTADGEDYFRNPEVMYEALGFLYDLEERGRLHCSCGSRQVEIDVLPDAIQLNCPRCGRREQVGAATEEDLQRLKISRR